MKFRVNGHLINRKHINGRQLGVKIRNLKVEFKTGGTWRRVGQQTLIMKIYDFFLFDLVV